MLREESDRAVCGGKPRFDSRAPALDVKVCKAETNKLRDLQKGINRQMRVGRVSGGIELRCVVVV